MQKQQLEKIKKSIAFIGLMSINPEGKPVPLLVGTGVFLHIENCFHLVTSKHVIAFINEKGAVTKEKSGILIFSNVKSAENKCRCTQIEAIKQHGMNWHFHDDEKVDLAIIPFPINTKNDDVLVVPQNMYLETKELCETHEVFYLSYQPGISMIESDGRVMPIVRKGMISRVNSDKTFYVDGSAFPGNSGSPVFMLPSLMRVTDNAIHIGRDDLGGKFLGIIGDYLPYRDVAVSRQTGNPRIVFEENTGLSRVWSIDYINEIINKREFKEHIQKIKGQSTR